MSSAVFFISGHGFGHASREVEVINALAAVRPGLRIIIRSAVQPSLLARTVRGPYDLRPGACDTGIVQTDSVTHDDPATIREAIAFYRTLGDRATAEAEALQEDAVRIVVGDIPPLAFDTAVRLGVPSIGIANFTWDWIYAAMPALTGAAPGLVPDIARAYRGATLALELPMSGGLDIFPRREPLPLIARRATRSRNDTRHHFQVPLDRPAALFSFGGYGLPSLDLGKLDCLDDRTVLTTTQSSGSPNHLNPPNPARLNEAAFVGSGFRYEDLVAAVDVVVSKPGYGIIAECAANGTALLYTSRGAFREYDVLVREMPAFVRARFIDQRDLFAGRWRASLEALLAQPSPPKPRVDGAELAAQHIAQLAGA